MAREVPAPAPFAFQHVGCELIGEVHYVGYHHPDYEVRLTVDGCAFMFKLVVTVPGGTASDLRYSVTWFKNEAITDGSKFEAISDVSRLPVDQAFGKAIEFIVAYHKQRTDRGNNSV